MQASTEKIWASAQEKLSTMLSGDTYNLWFAPLRVAVMDNNVVTLQVANDFCEVWLNDNYLGLLQDVLTHVAGRPLQVKFKVVPHPCRRLPHHRLARRRERRMSPPQQSGWWGTAKTISTRNTPSKPSSSAITTISPTPRRWRWLKRPASHTIRSSSTAASVWARPICCTPSASALSAISGARAWPI